MYSGLPLIPAAGPPGCRRPPAAAGSPPGPPRPPLPLATPVPRRSLLSDAHTPARRDWEKTFGGRRPPPYTAGNPLWDVTELLPLGKGATLSGKEGRDDRALFADHLAGPHQNLHDGAVGGRARRHGAAGQRAPVGQRVPGPPHPGPAGA